MQRLFREAGIPDDAEEEKEYVNPTTGERGGPRGPEPTRCAPRRAALRL